MKNYFINMKISTKFLITPTVIMVFLLVSGGIPYRVFYSQQDALKGIYKNQFGTYQLTAPLLCLAENTFLSMGSGS